MRLEDLPFFAQPMGARPVPGVRTELGFPVYQDIGGNQFSVMPESAPVEMPAMANDPRGLRVPDGNATPRSGMGASAAPPAWLGSVAGAMTQGLLAPARAARGEPVTYGDAFATAMDYGLLGAPMSAPEGALRTLASRTDASATFGPGAMIARYVDEPTGGYMNVLQRPNGGRASVLDFEVPEAMRRQGGGTRLLDEAMAANPNFGGQISSKEAARIAYRAGRRPPNMPNASLDDVFRMIDENSSVNMVTQPPAPVSPAQEVARMLSGGRAADVTDDMMAAVDPQEMWRLYESGATGAEMPMDEASRMARAREIGFDADTPLYHGTGADFPAFDPSYRGGVADAYSARRADWLVDSPITADGYANMAARDAPVARLIKQSEAAERAGQWDLASRLMAEAEQLEQTMPLQAGQSVVPVYSPRPSSVIDADFGGVNDLENSMRDALGDARKNGGVGVEFRNFNDHPDYSVEDYATHRGIFDASNIRSRFARFDPRLSHLRNLSASMAGLLGANAIYDPEAQ